MRMPSARPARRPGRAQLCLGSSGGDSNGSDDLNDSDDSDDPDDSDDQSINRTARIAQSAPRSAAALRPSLPPTRRRPRDSSRRPRGRSPLASRRSRVWSASCDPGPGGPLPLCILRPWAGRPAALVRSRHPAQRQACHPRAVGSKPVRGVPAPARCGGKPALSASSESPGSSESSGSPGASGRRDRPRIEALSREFEFKQPSVAPRVRIFSIPGIENVSFQFPVVLQATPASPAQSPVAGCE